MLTLDMERTGLEMVRSRLAGCVVACGTTGLAALVEGDGSLEDEPEEGKPEDGEAKEDELEATLRVEGESVESSTKESPG